MTTEELNEIASRLRRTANDSLGGESLHRHSPESPRLRLLTGAP